MRKIQYYFEKIIRQWLFLLVLPSTLFSYSSSDDTLTAVLTNAVDYAQSGPARALCVLQVQALFVDWQRNNA